MIILLNITRKYHRAASATKLVFCNNQTEKSQSIFEGTKADANIWVSIQKCHPCPTVLTENKSNTQNECFH